MCDLLNTFFTSVFTKEDTTNIPQPVRVCQGEPMSPINVERDDVKVKISKLKLNSAPGPDKFSPRTLRELEDEISYFQQVTAEWRSTS